MKKNLLHIAILCSILLSSCQNAQKGNMQEETTDTDTIIVDADQYLLMETSEGNITLKLYRETPLHRHNFVKTPLDWYGVIAKLEQVRWFPIQNFIFS